MNKAQIRKIYDITKKILFPLCLLLFACLRANKGIDLTDSTYSLGNYEFISEGNGVWFLLTFVSNWIGRIIMCLPFGGYMLGFKIYSSLLVGGFAVIGYRFFRTKMPAWLAFLAEVAAIGLCWCPTTILYHYLTYGFLLMGSIFLFRGLASSRSYCLFIAGAFLGINAFVRFPNNGLEVLLILPLIFYGVISKKTSKEIFRLIGICIVGYISTFLIVLIAMMCIYGADVPSMLINGTLGIAGSASDYTFGSMIVSILNAYWHGMKWALYLVFCSLVGVPFFVLFENKFLKARKVIYVLCIVFLCFVLMKFGMFNFKYYQKEAALQWGAVFLLISIVIDLMVIIGKRENRDWRLIAAISLVTIIITPLGSNNYIWPILNSLFFIAPVTFWMSYKYIRWGRTYLDRTKKVMQFPFKAMLCAAIVVFFIQAVGVGTRYVFLQGEESGEKISSAVEGNDKLKGMKTTAYNAENLSSLSIFMNENEEKYKDKQLILYGNIPGLSYILDRPSALNTSWSDLASNPVDDMKEAILQADGKNAASRPLVILAKDRVLEAESIEDQDNITKFELINDYINTNGYSAVFENDVFIVYE